MAAEWIPVFILEGFDKDAAPRWQMVPRDGERFVALRDGAGLTVTSTDATIVTVMEIDVHALPIGRQLSGRNWRAAGYDASSTRMPLYRSDRIFRLHGVAKGNAKICAKQAAVLKAELEVGTKNRKTVTVCFNFVHDLHNKHHTVRHEASAQQWVNDVNAIYNGQANVFVTLLGARRIDVEIDLGKVADFWPASEWDTIIAKGIWSADLNYFLVRKYEKSTPKIDDDNAITLDRNGAPAVGGCIVILEDHLTSGKPTFVTIGHEMGHHLGAENNKNPAERDFLMFWWGDRTGVYLPKADVNVMNHHDFRFRRHGPCMRP
jgi:hypothetical protein